MIHLEYKRQQSVRITVTPGVTYRVVAAAWGPGVQVLRIKSFRLRERLLVGERIKISRKIMLVVGAGAARFSLLHYCWQLKHPLVLWFELDAKRSEVHGAVMCANYVAVQTSLHAVGIRLPHISL